jgi:hypothetical protein
MLASKISDMEKSSSIADLSCATGDEGATGGQRALITRRQYRADSRVLVHLLHCEYPVVRDVAVKYFHWQLLGGRDARHLNSGSQDHQY